MLLPEESVAPVALVAASLLCIQQSGALDPLTGGWIRCAEAGNHGFRVGLQWRHGLLSANYVWDGSGYDNTWLAAVEAIEPCPSSY